MTGLVWHQASLEQRAFWRNPEAAFFTFAVPLGVLAIFGATAQGNLTLFVPGIVAFGIILAAYANLGTTVAVLRADGVLKRIRATPLPPSSYVEGQLLSVLLTCMLIAACTAALGWAAFGAVPRSVFPFGVTLLVGIVCFTALGLAISTVIPSPTSAAAITNGTYIPLALISGTFDTSIHLPAWLNTPVSALPIKALTDGLKAGYDPHAHGWPLSQLGVLLIWSVAGILIAVRRFRWS